MNIKFEEQLDEIQEGLRTLLVEKNIRYGNSALEPSNVFYKGDSVSSILIRMDDKVNRLRESDSVRLNDIVDLIGYGHLYLISKGITSEEIKKLID